MNIPVLKIYKLKLTRPYDRVEWQQLLIQRPLEKFLEYKNDHMSFGPCEQLVDTNHQLCRDFVFLDFKTFLDNRTPLSFIFDLKLEIIFLRPSCSLSKPRVGSANMRKRFCKSKE